MLLVAAAVVYGGTQTGTQWWLEWALIAVGVTYAFAKLLSAEHFQLSRWMLGAAGVLASLGWLSALHPVSVFDWGLRVFVPTSLKTWWPWGTVDGDISIHAMRRVSGMLGALLMAGDLGSHVVWRRSALSLMAWTGVAEAVFGLMHRVSGDIGNYWGTVGTLRFKETAFGFFWYHGNAGAFLNLCWPLLVTMTSREFSRPPSGGPFEQLRRAGHVLGLLCIASAIWVNHSRAAQAIFLVQALVTAVVLALNHASSGTVTRGGMRSSLVVAGAFILALAILGYAFDLGKSLNKWARFGDGGVDALGRWGVLRTCWQWMDQVPALGFGPGTFSAVFLVKSNGMADVPSGYWQFAHNDYLQTFLEWGWMGLLFWMAIGCSILGGLIFTTLKTVHSDRTAAQVKMLSVTVALLSLALHAFVDFPLQIFAIQLYVATLAGVGVSLINERDQATAPGGGKLRKRRPHRRASNLEDHAGAP